MARVASITNKDFERLENVHSYRLRAKEYEHWNMGSSSGEDWIASAPHSGSSERMISTMDAKTKKITHSFE